MTTLSSATRVFRVAFFLTSAALTSACETGADSPAAASGTGEAKVQANTETKAALTADTATRPASGQARLEDRAVPAQAQHEAQAIPAQAQVEGRAIPGKAQLDLAAAQLAEASARLNGLAAGATVEANAKPGNPSLKVGTPGAAVDAKVQAGNPSLNIGKAGTIIDANVQPGKPSLNIGGLKATANASAGKQAD